MISGSHHHSPNADKQSDPISHEITSDDASDKRLEKVIGQKARDLRLRTGLSIAAMAKRAGISKAMLSKIENAQTSCSLTTLGSLARGLDVPVTALLRGADSPRESMFVKNGHGATIVGRGTHAGHHYE